MAALPEAGPAAGSNFDDRYGILKRHADDYARLIVMQYTSLDENTAKIVANYVADGKIMDRAGWKEYFGVEIGAETPEVQAALAFSDFYRYWHGPNPRDVMENRTPARQVCQSSLIPVVRPQTLTFPDGTQIPFTLIDLGRLVREPKKRPAAQYWSENTQTLVQHGETRAGPSRLVVLLQDVVARNKPWSREADDLDEKGQVQYLQELNRRTGYGCRNPDTLSQVTVLFAHHVMTGQRPFGDATGMEGRWTYGRTEEEVEIEGDRYHVIAGNFETGPLDPLRGSAPARLDVSSRSFDREYGGVGVLR